MNVNGTLTLYGNNNNNIYIYVKGNCFKIYIINLKLFI